MSGENEAESYYRKRAAGKNGNQYRQPKRSIHRRPGETNEDAIARLAGELRAAEFDRDQYKAELDDLRGDP